MARTHAHEQPDRRDRVQHPAQGAPDAQRLLERDQAPLGDAPRRDGPSRARLGLLQYRDRRARTSEATRQGGGAVEYHARHWSCGRYRRLHRRHLGLCTRLAALTRCKVAPADD